MSETILYFDELTVGDIIALVMTLGTKLCHRKNLYIVHGTNLRAAWDDLNKNKNDYDRVRDILGITTPNPVVPVKMIEEVKKFLKKGSISDDDIERGLYRQFYSNLPLEEDKKTDDKKFEEFSNLLFEKLKNGPGLEIRLLRTKPQRKKSK